MSDHDPHTWQPHRWAATICAITEEGWRALTDDGHECELPADALVGALRLHPGQRVTVTANGHHVTAISIGAGSDAEPT